MYSEELERLITVATEDGTLSEKERQILVRRATNEGIDPDEFEMVLDNRLRKAAAQQPPSIPQPTAPPQQPEQPRTIRVGQVHKCPQCGASIPSFQATCSHCGHEFRNVAVGNTVLDLQQKIDAVRLKTQQKNEGRLINKSTDRAIAQVVSSYLVPNEAEALRDVLMLSTSHISTVSRQTYASSSAFLTLYKQCIARAKVLFPNDDFYRQYEEMEPELRMKLRRSNWLVAIPLILLEFVIAIFGLASFSTDYPVVGSILLFIFFAILLNYFYDIKAIKRKLFK